MCIYNIIYDILYIILYIYYLNVLSDLILSSIFSGGLQNLFDFVTSWGIFEFGVEELISGHVFFGAIGV